jgi:hypothetical protein
MAKKPITKKLGIANIEREYVGLAFKLTLSSLIDLYTKKQIARHMA